MKLCTVCGVVTSRAGSRCTEHARQSNRSRHNALYSTRAWQRLSARVLRAWRGEHGDWCPGYQRLAHPASDLTVDHVVPLAAGGAPFDVANTSVLCRSCNSTKGASTGGGVAHCVCGRRLRNDGTFADGRHRKQHANPCEAWGRKARLGDETWEAPVLAQVAGIALDADTMASVVAALGSSRQPVAIDRARIDRQMRELALEHAAGGMGDEAYLARLKALRQQRDVIVERTAVGLPAERAVEWLRALGESLQAPEKSKEKADVLHAIYDRITVAGPEIVGVRLTQAAYAHGLALALPEKVEMARPTVSEFTT